MQSTPAAGLRILLCIAANLLPCLAEPSTGKPGGTAPIQVSPDQIHAYFSPKGGCTAAILEEIRGAKQFILVQAYSFTSAPIAGALVEAFRSGIRVEAVLDKSNKTANYSEATFLKNARVPTWIDGKHAIAHNKVMVIDLNKVITGSFNFTNSAATRNAENFLILKSEDLAQQYRLQWKNHWAHGVE